MHIDNIYDALRLMSKKATCQGALATSRAEGITISAHLESLGDLWSRTSSQDIAVALTPLGPCGLLGTEGILLQMNAHS